MNREQLRAARALLGWSQDDLASVSGVSAPTIKRLEPGSGPVQTRDDTLAKLRVALEGAGITFPDISQEGQIGVHYTPPPESLPIYDPAAGSTGFLATLLKHGRHKTRQLAGFKAGTSFEIPKEMHDRIKAGESALKIFRECREMSRAELAEALTHEQEGLSVLNNSRILTERQLHAAEYIKIGWLPGIGKVAAVIGVAYKEIALCDKYFKPSTPPDNLKDDIADVRRMSDELAAKATPKIEKLRPLTDYERDRMRINGMEPRLLPSPSRKWGIE